MNRRLRYPGLDPATPDGYTLIVNNIGLSVNDTLRPHRGYVAMEALSPVSLAGFTPSMLVVNKAAGFNSVKEFVASAKSQPGKIPFGSAGAGSSTHLSMAYFDSVAGIKLLHVPYKGGGPATLAMIAGEVKALKNPEPAGKLQKAGLDPQPTTPQEFAKLIRSEIDRWRKVIREAGIK